jgi:hypothetical protein
VGAIPPPLFFEQRRCESIWLSRMASQERLGNLTRDDPPFERPARSSPTT